MNKYVYCICGEDTPQIKTFMAKSYKDAEEKLITKFGNDFDDDKILNEISTWEELSDYILDIYDISLSVLEDIEEL